MTAPALTQAQVRALRPCDDTFEAVTAKLGADWAEHPVTHGRASVPASEAGFLRAGVAPGPQRFTKPPHKEG